MDSIYKMSNAMNSFAKKNAQEMGVDLINMRKDTTKKEKDKHLNLFQMIKKYDYPIERH